MRKIFLAIFLAGAALPVAALEPGDRPQTAGPEATAEERREIIRRIKEVQVNDMRRERREKERRQLEEFVEGPSPYR